MSVAQAVDIRPSINDLVQVVEREHTLTLQAMRGVLSHAVAAGEALLEIQTQIPYGEWKKWCETTLPLSFSTINDYTRVAHFKAHLEANGVVQLEEALTILRGKRRGDVTAGPIGDGRVLERKARKMLAEGIPQKEIARQLGVSKTTVYWWLHPDRRKAHLRELKQRGDDARRARKADEEKRLAKVIRKQGGALAELYTMAERMQDVMAQAHREEEDRDARKSLSLAGQHYRRMRDEIVKALGAHA